MKTDIFQIDAFTNRIFGGNSAAVVPLSEWLDDAVLQNIAAENNLAETVFFVRESDGYRIRWFTPTVEVNLCGHATLAAAHVLFRHLGVIDSHITFQSKSGPLGVRQAPDNFLTLNFPVDHLAPAPLDSIYEKIFGTMPLEAYRGREDLLLIFSSADEVKGLTPDLPLMKTLACRGVIASAVGMDCDFVSRFFCPAIGIDEDPVTGSTHTTLTPYWAGKLNKNLLRARQVSKRGGELVCEIKGDRVDISGQAVTYLTGQIILA